MPWLIHSIRTSMEPQTNKSLQWEKNKWNIWNHHTQTGEVAKEQAEAPDSFSKKAISPSLPTEFSQLFWSWWANKTEVTGTLTSSKKLLVRVKSICFIIRVKKGQQQKQESKVGLWPSPDMSIYLDQSHRGASVVKSPPEILFYTWKNKNLLSSCAKRKQPPLLLLSGGGGEKCFSLSANEGLFNKNVTQN